MVPRIMRILFLTQIVPYPLDAGPKVRAYHVLQQLAARHQVTLVCFGRQNDSPSAIDHLRTLCNDVHVVPLKRTRSADLHSLCRSALSGQPFTILRDDLPEMRSKLTEIIASRCFDAIHADQLSMAAHALWAQQKIEEGKSHVHPSMVLDAHNAYYLIPQRLADVATNPLLKLFLRRETRLTARYEARTYAHFDHVITVTEQDLTAIRQLAQFDDNAPHFTTIPICVDASTPPIDRDPEARGLLMIGGLHWPPNADAVRWFFHEIWPLVISRVPHARVYIVGARPPSDIRALGNYVDISRPEKAVGAPVVVTGYVSDPAPFIHESAVLVVALRSGGGMRVKIVEAMQWGLPIVTTTIGCEGIHVTHEQDVLIADDPEAFAQSLVKVLREPIEAQKLAKGGRRLVAQCYDWRKAYAALDDIYQPDRNATHS
jgi:glycosyltransferase involved in cell wall biosynthesis